jgi:hypothetical protein
MRVFVVSQRNKPLMPCTQRKARLLLKEGKAKIYKYNPFTIKLKYATGESLQPCHIGIDTGFKHIGLAVTSNDKVLFKGKVELREYGEPQKDANGHNAFMTCVGKRKMMRRSRRNRKTRYRAPRFRNRKKPDGWLPPTTQAKLNSNFKWIDLLAELVPNPILHIEIAKFDVQKMMDPDIEGVGYQNGQTKGFWDVRYFVFARDNYTCQVCEGKSKDSILRTHHIVYKSMGGTDRADNLITICNSCHTGKNYKPGGILYDWCQNEFKINTYKEPPFMNIISSRIRNRYPAAYMTYGSVTRSKRTELKLEKTHYNDAIAISGIEDIKENPNDLFYVKQIRKKSRQLHYMQPYKGHNPNQTRRSANILNVKGIYKGDKVQYRNKYGYVTGFTHSSAYVNDKNGRLPIPENKTQGVISISKLKLVCHNANWMYFTTTV